MEWGSGAWGGQRGIEWGSGEQWEGKEAGRGAMGAGGEEGQGVGNGGRGGNKFGGSSWGLWVVGLLGILSPSLEVEGDRGQIGGRGTSPAPLAAWGHAGLCPQPRDRDGAELSPPGPAAHRLFRCPRSCWYLRPRPPPQPGYHAPSHALGTWPAKATACPCPLHPLHAAGAGDVLVGLEAVGLAPAPGDGSWQGRRAIQGASPKTTAPGQGEQPQQQPLLPILGTERAG